MTTIPIGRWKHATDLAARSTTAWLHCPGCERRVSLGRRHTIASGGTVSPSMVCPHADCLFHDFIQLEGWRRR